MEPVKEIMNMGKKKSAVITTAPQTLKSAC